MCFLGRCFPGYVLLFPVCLGHGRRPSRGVKGGWKEVNVCWGRLSPAVPVGWDNLGFLGFAIGGQGGHSRIGSFDSVAILVGMTILKIRVHRTKKNNARERIEDLQEIVR